jgi:tetratricopeptide (TPR) repeat protein
MSQVVRVVILALLAVAGFVAAGAAFGTAGQRLAALGVLAGVFALAGLRLVRTALGVARSQRVHQQILESINDGDLPACVAALDEVERRGIARNQRRVVDWARIVRAGIIAELGSPEDGLAQLRAIDPARVSPDLALAWHYEMGCALADAGKPWAAVAHLRHLEEADQPLARDVFAVEVRARTRAAEGKLDQAIAETEALVEATRRKRRLHPLLDRTRLRLAALLARAGRTEDARAIASDIERRSRHENLRKQARELMDKG